MSRMQTISKSLRGKYVVFCLSVAVAGMSWFGSIGRAQQTPTPPRLEYAFEVRAEVADPTVVGQMPNGTRRIVNILGGTFEGPKVKGKLLPGGADWQIIREDGFTEVDARYTLQTNTGHLIYVSNVGMRHAPPDVMKRLNAGETVDPSLIYFARFPNLKLPRPTCSG